MACIVLAGCANSAWTDARDLPRCLDSSGADEEGADLTPVGGTPPRLRNQAEITRLLEERYPPYLREMRIGGTVNVWVYVEADGHISEVKINESSGFEGMDQAAVGVARQMDFVPAVTSVSGQRCVMPIWVAMNLMFEVKMR